MFSDDQVWEYACHEGNYGMDGILAGHSGAEERDAAQDSVAACAWHRLPSRPGALSAVVPCGRGCRSIRASEPYQRVCELCHGAGGRGDIAPGLVPLGYDAEYVLAVVREGYSQMPPISTRELSGRRGAAGRRLPRRAVRPAGGAARGHRGGGRLSTVRGQRRATAASASSAACASPEAGGGQPAGGCRLRLRRPPDPRRATPTSAASGRC